VGSNVRVGSTPIFATNKFKMKKLGIPVDILYEECQVAIKKEIAKQYRDEAKEIIRLASREDRKEFLKYFHEDKGNICCLVLDRIKRDLVANEKWTAETMTEFGKPLI
jgi:hypothetical protein